MKLNALTVKIIYLFLLTIIVAQTSCSKPKTRKTPSITPKNKAASNINDNFEVIETIKNPKALISSKNFHIKIKKTALNKLFLLAPSLIDFHLAPRVTHLKPKVISFGLVGGKIAMFEADSQMIYDDIASNKLIQTFKILRESDNDVEVEFEMGFSNINNNDNLGIAELPSQQSKSEVVFIPTQSYIQSANIDKNNGLIIVQNSRVKSASKTGSQEEENYIIQTRITPYIFNEKFIIKTTSANDMKHVGFFVTEAKQKIVGTDLLLASHWDISSDNPITYVITKNTPVEFIEAIKEGILYWNQALGKNLIKVELNGDPQEIGSYRRNIVHWAPWATAGFAVASAQSDPFTGELLTTNVYLTSFFPLYYSDKFIRDSRFTNNYKTLYTNTIVPTGFEFGFGCLDFNEINQNLDTLKQSSNPLSPEMVAKIQKDILRYVVAHEVGHTMGLRHNFAGSLETQFTNLKEREVEFENYSTSLDHKGSKTTSSVMDYLDSKDVLLTGAFIKSNILPYDENAIAWGYSLKKINLENIPKFCSDIEYIYGNLLDCAPRDSGQNPISSIVESQNIFHKQFLFKIYENLISNYYPNSPNSIIKHIQSITPPDKLAQITSKELEKVRRFYSSKAEILKLNRSFGSTDLWQNKVLISTELASLQQNELNKFGGNFIGILKNLFNLNDDLQLNLDPFSTDFNRFIHSNKFGLNNLTTENNSSYELTESEKTQVKNFMTEYSKKYFESYFTQAILVLSGTFPNLNYNYNPDLNLSSWEVELKKFILKTALTDFYPESIRSSILNLTNETIFGARIGWMEDTKIQIANELRSKIEKILNTEQLIIESNNIELFSLNDIYLKIRKIKNKANQNKAINEFNILVKISEIADQLNTYR